MAHTVLERDTISNDTAVPSSSAESYHFDGEQIYDHNLYMRELIDLYLAQILNMSNIFEMSINATMMEVDESVTNYLESAKSMDATVQELVSSQSERYSIKLKKWIELSSNIETALHEVSQNFVMKLRDNQQSIQRKRLEDLESIKTRVRYYTDRVIETQISFQESSSKLDKAITDLNMKTQIIDRTLTKLRDSNNSDMSKALGNTIISRRSLENSQRDLMETMKNKASISLNRSVGNYVDKVKEKRWRQG
jgi:hypothetical protein